MPENRTFTATFAIVTPLFLAGAQQDKVEIRAASLRGALRFWWRALAWAEVAGHHDQGTALARLRQLETLLFGHAGSQKQSHKAALSIVVEPSPFKTVTVNQGSTVGLGVRYLGYGLITDNDSKKSAGQFLRPYIKENQGFRAHFRLTPARGVIQNDCSKVKFETAVELFERALHLFGLIGGLGSRTRRGWGSIALHTLEGDIKPFTRPENVEEYIDAVKQTLPPQQMGVSLPPYTAFYQGSRIDVLVPKGKSAISVLNTMGQAMQRYRSRTNGRNNFPKDAKWLRNPLDIPHPQSIPEKASFGLPINYAGDIAVSAHIPKINSDRRASPLILHVHKLSEMEFVGVSLLMKSEFLPQPQDEYQQLIVEKGKRDDPENYKSITRPYRINWSVLTIFLEKNFPDRQAVYP